MIQVVKKYLDVCHYSHLKSDFEDLFLSHPNYPSVYAITDSLETLSIENIVVKVPKESFEQLPISFLTLLDGKMVLVTKTKHQVLIETEKGTKEKLGFNGFLSRWNQVIIAIESNVTINSIPKKLNLKWLFYTLPVIALISLSVLYNAYDKLSVVVLLTSLSGLLVSILILQEKLGIKNEMISKICNSGFNFSCQSVIQSSLHKKWVNFADLPFIFFSICAALILISPTSSTTIVGILGITSIPIILYSVFLQKFQLKKWCVLCLLVSGILLLQSLVFGFSTASFFTLSLKSLTIFFLVTILITSFWFMSSPILEDKIKLSREVLVLKRLKRNFTVLMSLSKEVLNVPGLNLLQPIHFGNKFAPLQITLILSPTCGHCHTAFQQGMELIKKFPEKISLHILFNINPENDNNPYQTVVENLLYINLCLPEKVAEAISDWHIKNMSLDTWLKKWQFDKIDNDIKNQIFHQYHWCLENKFSYAPVTIFNEKLFPNEYTIDELKYFINNFHEQEAAHMESNLIEA